MANETHLDEGNENLTSLHLHIQKTMADFKPCSTPSWLEHCFLLWKLNSEKGYSRFEMRWPSLAGNPFSLINQWKLKCLPQNNRVGYYINQKWNHWCLPEQREHIIYLFGYDMIRPGLTKTAWRHGRENRTHEISLFWVIDYHYVITFSI